MKFEVLSDLIDFNPTIRLQKGTIAKKVAMENVQPRNKFIESFEKAAFSSGSKFQNNDTLLARITPCLENGKTAFVDFLPDNEQIAFGSTEFIVMRAKKGKCDPEFLYYLAISPDFRDIAIKSMIGTSGRQRVQLDVLKNLRLQIPSLHVQKKIGRFLSSLDKKIRINNQINDDLHSLVEILFEKVYSEGTPTLLGDFLSSIESGSRPKGGAGEGTIPSIGAEKIEKFGTYDYSGEKYISEDYFNKLKRGVVQAGDVLLYKDGAYTGKVSMALGGFPHRKCAVNERVFLLRTPGKSYQSYLYFSLSQKEVREKVFAIASGKAAQPGLNQKELSDIEINLPDAATLTKFEGTAKPFLDEIAKRAIENRCLASLRDTLLPKLLSGEVSI